MAESNFALNRLNNNNLKDKKIGQGYPFLKIVTITSTNSSQIGIASAIYSSLKANPPDLAFMESGSLMSYSSSSSGKGSYFWQSPLATDLNEIPDKTNIIGNNPNFSKLIDNATNTNTNNMGLDGEVYISPMQGKFILQNLSDSSNNIYLFNVFYNPINASNITDAQVSSNADTYCSIIGNTDPLCYCQAGTTTCAGIFLPGNLDALKAKSETDYQNALNNCVYLSPMCQAWAGNGNTFVSDEISTAKKDNKNGVPICGAQFSFSRGTLLSTTGKNILQQCDFQSRPTVPGGPIPVNPSDNPSATGGNASTPSKSGGGFPIPAVIAICIIVFIIVVMIGIKL